MVASALDGYPLEACGLLGGRPWTGRHGQGRGVLPGRQPGRLRPGLRGRPRALLRADRAAEAAGGQLIGVFHSHTHTEGQPSPTDVAQAPDPDWHYVLVSLRDVHPSVRSWRIQDGKITEEPVVLQW